MPLSLSEEEELELLELESQSALALKKRVQAQQPEETDKERGLFGLSPEAEKSTFPTTSEKKGIGGSFLQGFEALGTPTRALGTLRTNPETGEKFKTSDPESRLFKPEEEKLKALVPEKGIPFDFPGLPSGSTIPKGVVGGAIEAVGSLASDPTLVLSALPKVVKKATKAGIKAVIEFPNKLLGKAQQQLTGVAEEALRKGGTRAGRQELQKGFGTQGKIAKKILHKLDNLDDYLPEKQIIEEALAAIPEISINKTTRALRGYIDPQAIGKGKSANKKIAALADDIDNTFAKKINGTKFRALRMKIDDEIGDFGKDDPGQYKKALLAARTQMKEMMERATAKTGNPQHATAMKSMHEKLTLADKFKGYTGKSRLARERATENFVKRLFGKPEDARETLEGLSKIFGEDFVKESKIAQLAGQLGEGGRADLFPRWTTGKSLLGSELLGRAAGFAAGSPLVSSRVTLPLADLAEKGILKVGKGAGKVASKIPAGVSGASTAITGANEDISEFLKRKMF